MPTPTIEITDSIFMPYDDGPPPGVDECQGCFKWVRDSELEYVDDELYCTTCRDSKACATCGHPSSLHAWFIGRCYEETCDCEKFL